MSTNAHKEFRFILPILPLLCLLTGSHVRALFVGQRRSRVRLYLMGTVWVVANLIAVLYLGLFHQSGPVLVNREIVQRAVLLSQQQQSKSTTTPLVATIHYLTGACHSTPLHSHLHTKSPGIQFDTWHLNCSPACRANPPCESERFAADPVNFVRQAYCVDLKTRRERKRCQPSAVPPD